MASLDERVKDLRRADDLIRDALEEMSFTDHRTPTLWEARHLIALTISKLCEAYIIINTRDEIEDDVLPMPRVVMQGPAA